MIITSITFHRFKKYRNCKIDLKPSVTLLAGGNNAGKTSLLQGLAIWEFCRTVIETEKGKKSLCTGTTRQGTGIGDDEFTPVNVPSLKHLWTNLKAQKEDESNGYTLWVRVDWTHEQNAHFLSIGLSLANDRLFIKTLATNVAPTDVIPHVAYIPSFAGIAPKESRYTPATIRRFIGQGLPGAILRNVILDLFLENARKRTQEKQASGGKKLKQAFLRQLRRDDPYEQLQELLRSVFSFGLRIKEFNEIYHSNITIESFKGEYLDNRFQRIPDYNPRDLMVEGSGFLQWLTVLALTLDPKNSLILLDEPDAHLHPALQQELLSELTQLSEKLGKQVIYSTHSSELIKNHPHTMILDTNRTPPCYLNETKQVISLLSGIGAEYAPRFDAAKKKRRVLFVENASDLELLKIMAKKLSTPISENFVVWPWASRHKERKILYLQMKNEISDLIALSLVDRDNDAVNSVDADLSDKSYSPNHNNGFHAMKWRRRNIEGYLLHPDAIARATNKDAQTIIDHVIEKFALDLSGRFLEQNEPNTFLQADGKIIISEDKHSIENTFGVNKYDIANAIQNTEIPKDFKIMVAHITNLFNHHM